MCEGYLIFLGHASFYRRLIKNFSKIARPLTNLLAKDVHFTFDNWCITAWEKLKIELFLHQSFLSRIGESHLRLCTMLLILSLVLT